MKSKINRIIGNTVENNTFSIGILFFRLVIGVLMLTHGFAKLSNFEMMSSQFPDILGIGSQWNLILVIFAEFGCSILLILGLFTRLATIPLIITMLVAIFVAHASDPFAMKEMPVLYLAIYLFVLIVGSGKFSVDYLLNRKLK